MCGGQFVVITLQGQSGQLDGGVGRGHQPPRQDVLLELEEQLVPDIVL